ncbi:MAG: sulfatase-like hydrolase/transferase, partial [Gemmatimonadota bacterium]|nr:sulfatase-like hydrolase/transferase [Gemmatimonadota bacterium]
MLISAGNWLSFQVVGTLLNADNLFIAISWLRGHPETVTQDRGGRLLLLSAGGLVVLAFTWASASFLALRGGVTQRSAPWVLRTSLGLVVTLQIVAASALLSRTMRSHFTPGTSRGYWSATATSLRGAEHWAPLELALPSATTIRSSYREIVYDGVPASDSNDGAPVIGSAPLGKRSARHIVVISLETAARKYYPLLDNPALPTFARMSSRGISSEHHLATNPATTWAIYSMVTGTYPRRGRSLLDYGDFSSDGLAAQLGQHGYETSYLDSYRIDWQSGFHRDHDSRMVKDLGFMRMDDMASRAESAGREDAFHAAVARERQSLARALERIDDARGHRAHAFVFIATILGHYPWTSAKESRSLSGAEKVTALTRTLDGLVAELLDGIEKRGLTDSVIVVVTGDHGLRAKAEFASLHEQMRFGMVSFNVPFILYAPGLFDHGVRLPYVTSHVDIAPTLLALVGIPTDFLLFHGTDMLDPQIRNRTTFMFNNSLRPVDGYYRKGWLYVYNAFTGEAHVERSAEGSTSPTPGGHVGAEQPSEAMTARVARTLDRAAGILDTTSAYFLQRGARGRATAGPPHTSTH